MRGHRPKAKVMAQLSPTLCTVRVEPDDPETAHPCLYPVRLEGDPLATCRCAHMVVPLVPVVGGLCGSAAAWSTSSGRRPRGSGKGGGEGRGGGFGRSPRHCRCQHTQPKGTGRRRRERKRERNPRPCAPGLLVAMAACHSGSAGLTGRTSDTSPVQSPFTRVA